MLCRDSVGRVVEHVLYEATDPNGTQHGPPMARWQASSDRLAAMWLVLPAASRYCAVGSPNARFPAETPGVPAASRARANSTHRFGNSGLRAGIKAFGHQSEIAGGGWRGNRGPKRGVSPASQPPRPSFRNTSAATAGQPPVLRGQVRGLGDVGAEVE